MALYKPHESEIQKAILYYLKIRGHFCFRNNTGAFSLNYKGKNRFFRSGVVGSSDILGCMKGTGRMFAIEVKRPGNKATEPQEEFIESINRCGGLAFVAFDVNDVIQAGF